MPKISIDMTKMETTVVFADQLADMADTFRGADISETEGMRLCRKGITLLTQSNNKKGSDDGG